MGYPHGPEVSTPVTTMVDRHKIILIRTTAPYTKLKGGRRIQTVDSQFDWSNANTC